MRIVEFPQLPKHLVPPPAEIDEPWHGQLLDEMEGNQRRTSPLTVRTLETIIRLATAFHLVVAEPDVDLRDSI